jgi:hypothetical protein
MMYHPEPVGPFRHSMLSHRAEWDAMQDEARQAARERADRLADELSRAFAGYGAEPALVSFLDDLALADRPRRVPSPSGPLAWFKRFFH